MEAKGRRYEKKDKEFWSKTGQRNVKTIHKTSGRFPRKKEASRDTTGQSGTSAKATHTPEQKGSSPPKPEAKKRKTYLPWDL